MTRHSPGICHDLAHLGADGPMEQHDASQRAGQRQGPIVALSERVEVERQLRALAALHDLLPLLDQAANSRVGLQDPHGEGGSHGRRVGAQVLACQLTKS